MNNITYDKKLLTERGERYCEKNSINIARLLGFGTQGMVFKTSRNTAIKVYGAETGYKRECAVYKRLETRKVFSIRGLAVPRIMNWNDALYTFEMSIVHTPCIIDFGGAYVDQAPDHMIRDEEWLSIKAEEFGSHWAEAQAVIREIEHRATIWLVDINTGNIKFE